MEFRRVLFRCYFKEWRTFIMENPYASLNDWLVHLKAEKKRGTINVHEATEIIKFSSMRSYEGSYKIIIIWLPENMGIEASNKILKSLEEPGDKTIFLLVTENENVLLPTIISRCQLVKLNRLSEQEIEDFLVNEKGVNQKIGRAHV